MKIGIWTSDRELAKNTVTKIADEFDTNFRYRVSLLEITARDEQNNVIQWVRPTESARGYKFDKAYVDIRVNMDILFTIILPCLWHGDFDDLIWIADERTTVYDYLHALPQPLFEAFILNLMRRPLTEERQEWFHEWMEQPYEKVFPACNLSELKSDLTMPLDHMTMLLGKTAETLPIDKQEKLKNAMKDYCEVCDYVNQQLTDHQKAE